MLFLKKKTSTVIVTMSKPLRHVQMLLSMFWIPVINKKLNPKWATFFQGTRP